MADLPDGSGFEELLAYLRDNRGFDFTDYKRPTLLRRIARRMQTVEIETFDDYLDYLQVHPDEHTALFNTILINVTRFFRDEDTWRVLADRVVPAIVERHRESSRPIRVWSAGCSSGQEAFSIAMLFAETLGREECAANVKVYGTDVDEQALAYARQGRFSDRELESVPPPLRQRYFLEHDDGHAAFDTGLRRAVIFGLHDLVRDAPIGRLDLLLCRNTLMYFNTDLQAQVLRRFHFALRDTGVLVLGRAESLVSSRDLFETVEIHHRVFRPSAGARPNGNGAHTLARPLREPDDRNARPPAEMLAAVFDGASDPQVLVSATGFVVAANDAARRALHVGPEDVGRPFRDHELSYRPAELRSLIDQARATGELQHVAAVPTDTEDGQRWFDVDVAPLRSSSRNGSLGVGIVFRDVSASKRLEWELQNSNRALEDAYEELQSANEELETTNEELQSTIEELETTNEELQSANEELETMNEELQSTNAQLEAMNDLLEDRSAELDRTNAYLGAILRTLGSALVVVDPAHIVRLWSDQSEDLWGLRAEEVVGQSLYDLDVGLPVSELEDPVRRCLTTAQRVGPVVLGAHDRRGHDVRCSVTCAPLADGSGAVTGVSLLIMAEREPA